MGLCVCIYTTFVLVCSNKYYYFFIYIYIYIYNPQDRNLILHILLFYIVAGRVELEPDLLLIAML